MTVSRVSIALSLSLLLMTGAGGGCAAAATQDPGARSALLDSKDAFSAVDPFIGTEGGGHTFPGATVPFGMIQLSPDTQTRYYKQSYPWAAGYQYQDPTILGFSHTHFSGCGTFRSRRRAHGADRRRRSSRSG